MISDLLIQGAENDGIGCFDLLVLQSTQPQIRVHAGNSCVANIASVNKGDAVYC